MRLLLSVPGIPLICLASVAAPLTLAACGDDEAGAPDAADPGPDAGGAPDAAVAPALLLLDHAIAVDVSPDGAIAVFEDLSSGTARLILVDTATGQARDVAAVGDPSRTIATGISDGGRVSALWGEPVQAGVWTEAGGWVGLGSPHAEGCGEDLSSAFDVSADGATVVGLAWDGCAVDALWWDDTGGAGTFRALERLGAPPEGASRGPTNRATVISDDGEVAGGFAEIGARDRSPAIWDASGDGTLIDPDGEQPGEVLAISADGAVVAGNLGADGFVWTAEGGMVSVPRTPDALPSDPVFPNVTTGDGQVVLGGVGSAFFGTPVAFAWTADGGTVTLASVAEAAGVEVPEGTLFNSVMGVSADGTVVIGTAMDAELAPKTFVLRLPAGAFSP